MKKGYGQHCPIALGAEVFAERWTPIILRNLMVGCHRFNTILEGAPGLPRSVLSQRLRRLEEDGVVERRDHEYHLTECGRELTDVCMALGMWASRWREPQPSHHDPYLALWTMSRLIEPALLPCPRVVLRFDLTDRSERYWLVLSVSGNEVCLEDPGFTEDGVLTTNTDWLIRWQSGSTPPTGAILDGPPWLDRALTTWSGLTPFGRNVPSEDLSQSAC
ncbi:helix-turn-helix domain-containing protein [Acrocarpospora sp. B8E8]|uniref:winged helix-turn-helix transcriptional regulator n=1 Tax=Acrocarpospora sp. B8E8 TaxID=3153572 RepID=UPI00325E55A5